MQIDRSEFRAVDFFNHLYIRLLHSTAEIPGAVRNGGNPFGTDAADEPPDGDGSAAIVVGVALA